MKLRVILKYVIAVIFTVIIISCAKPKEKSGSVKAYNISTKDIIASKALDTANPDFSKTIEYIGTDNGFAFIDLKVRPDNIFSLYMKLLGQPETNDTDKQYTFSGVWTKDSSKLYFTFLEKKPHMESFFEKGDTIFEVLSDSSFSFRYKYSEFIFYGVTCELKE